MDFAAPIWLNEIIITLIYDLVLFIYTLVEYPMGVAQLTSGAELVGNVSESIHIKCIFGKRDLSHGDTSWTN